MWNNYHWPETLEEAFTGIAIGRRFQGELSIFLNRVLRRLKEYFEICSIILPNRGSNTGSSRCREFSQNLSSCWHLRCAGLGKGDTIAFDSIYNKWLDFSPFQIFISKEHIVMSNNGWANTRQFYIVPYIQPAAELIPLKTLMRDTMIVL